MVVLQLGFEEIIWQKEILESITDGFLILKIDSVK